MFNSTRLNLTSGRSPVLPRGNIAKLEEEEDKEREETELKTNVISALNLSTQKGPFPVGKGKWGVGAIRVVGRGAGGTNRKRKGCVKGLQ